MANPNPPKHSQFQKGQSGNPGGKPIGARTRLSNAFLTALAKDFEANGANAIAVLRAEKPEKYCELIADILPKETTLNVDTNSTVTHRVESVSDTARWIAESLGRRAASEVGELGEDRPLLSAEVRTQQTGH